MNDIEFVPTGDAVLAVIHRPNGETSIQEMSWEEFDRLRKACESDL